ncbi:MAG TPA: hypothetical protein RMH99_05890 [Sandaracinaceae bacterium LLY-WYZ-13_1]|nr:hypothetical protein [Sandaracinaceae bacterium LLY-WYZ-13_1]
MSVEDEVGRVRYAAMRAALKACFPEGAEGPIDDEVVDELFRIAKHEGKAEALRDADLDPPRKRAAAKKTVTKPPAEKISFYVAHAKHTRTAAPWSEFTEELPLVRVALPGKGVAHELPPIETEAGDVLPNDRLFGSIQELWNRYGATLGVSQKPKRVDLITPPRFWDRRFGAIAVYLGYANAGDPAPSFYVLEAGRGSGQPAQSYVAPTMDTTIVERTDYRPTPFSSPSHTYRGKLTMRDDAPGEPEHLRIEVFRQNLQGSLSDRYVDVSVDYEPRAEPDTTWPLVLQVLAGARLIAIGEALDWDVEGLDQQWVLEVFENLAGDSLFDQPPTDQPPT